MEKFTDIWQLAMADAFFMALMGETHYCVFGVDDGKVANKTIIFSGFHGRTQ